MVTPAGPADPVELFRSGLVIPAHPLALTEDRRLDERRQRALSRYYLESGAGGLAVAVHTTQFGIHDPASDLLSPVLELAVETAAEYPDRSTVLVGGLAGPTEQAVEEAELAAALGYHLALLSPYGTNGMTDAELIDRARAVGAVLPVIGFYLQPAVGGRPLPREFWRELAQVDSVIGIKVAPFDRYATLEVIHGITESGRADEIALYTGNDDHIVGDLISDDDGQAFVGGLLGQWAVWTGKAVQTLELARQARAGDDAALRRLVRLDRPLTDANAAIFDTRNGFAGSVPGIHEVLRRQGLLDGVWCLDDKEVLGPGQLAEIDRIWTAYPWLRDDDFVAEHRDRWLG